MHSRILLEIITFDVQRNGTFELFKKYNICDQLNCDFHLYGIEIYYHDISCVFSFSTTNYRK